MSEFEYTLFGKEWAAFADGCTFYDSEGHGRYHDVRVTLDEKDFAYGEVILQRDMPMPDDYLPSYLMIYKKGENRCCILEDAIAWHDSLYTKDNIALNWLIAAIERGEYSKQSFNI